MIQISREKAIEIIEFYVCKSSLGYDKIEKHLLKKEVIYDIVPPKEFFSAITNGSDELLKELLEII